MVVISYYSTRREKTSLRKQTILHIIAAIGLLLWAAFCFYEVPKLQAEQRGENIYVDEPISTPFSEMYESTEFNIETETNDVTYTEGEEPTVTQGIETTEEVTEEPTEVVCPYSEEEIYLMAQLIYSESGTESYLCQVYCGSVVMNRLNHDYYPDTIREVIFHRTGKKQIAQFSVIRVRKDGTRAIDCIPSEESLAAAREVLTYGSQLPPNVLFFYSERVTDNWVNTRKIYTQVDRVIFACEEPKED